jgi:hypothetical protein
MHIQIHTSGSSTSHFSRAYVSNVAILGVGCSLCPDSGTPKLPVEPLNQGLLGGFKLNACSNTPASDCLSKAGLECGRECELGG